MKGMDIFCASQAATAICLSMEHPSSSSPSPSPSPSLSSTILLGSSSPAIDRYNPIIRDSRRSAAAANPLPPLTHKNRHKKKLPPKQNGDHQSNRVNDKEMVNKNVNGRKSWSCTKPGDFISPPGSTRYLLSEKVLLNALSDFDPPALNHLFPAETSNSNEADDNQPDDAKPPSSSAAVDQVVVLRVSLHCRGCERKMRKHISRMEGVRSFNIDFAAKKVTVSGNVTPLEVLSSISKVKNAQLWGPSIAEFKGAAAAAAWATDKGSFVGVAS